MSYKSISNSHADENLSGLIIMSQIRLFEKMYVVPNKHCGVGELMDII